MSTLAAIAPSLVAELSGALAALGRRDAISKIESGVIERCTYDQSADAGYIYLVRPAPSRHFQKLAAPVAETIPLLEVGLNVDIDHDGYVFGIEFLSRPDIVAQLGEADAL
jgi:uncharacterized protein YuzE